MTKSQHSTSTDQRQILAAFHELLAEQQPVLSRITTKQEIAVREEDKNIVGTASTYTAESIVKGLADLQLNFGQAVDSLIAQLAVEAPKLEELRRAIAVETRHLEELRNTRIAADALDILFQEHQAKTAEFQEKSQQERQTLEQEIADTRQVWQKEQQEFETELQERQTALKKERTQQEADYVYELERQRKIEADDYAARKAALERKIAEEETKKSSDWTDREKILAGQQITLKQYKTLAETFPQELEHAVQKAREDAVKEVEEDAQAQAELFEKEFEADKQMYELKIASLQETVEEHNTQIEQLSAQLQSALRQVQELAGKALNAGKASV